MANATENKRKGTVPSQEELVAAGIADAILKAIEAKHIAPSWGEVEISEKAPTNPTGKAVVREYIKLEALGPQGMGLLCGGKMKPASPKDVVEKLPKAEQEAAAAAGAADYFNYGFDLEVRSKIRQKMTAELEGPEKAIKKFVVSLIAADYDAPTIRQMVLNSPKYKGVDGIENIVENALKAA